MLTNVKFGFVTSLLLLIMFNMALSHYLSLCNTYSIMCNTYLIVQYYYSQSLYIANLPFTIYYAFVYTPLFPFLSTMLHHLTLALLPCTSVALPSNFIAQATIQ